MGCSNSRTQSSPEDELAFKESEIGFSTFGTSLVCGVIKKYSSETQVSETQMTHILLKLGTNTQDIELLKSNFFRNSFFETPYKGYNRENLCVLGLLLSVGSVDKKTKELLSLLDPLFLGFVSREVLERTLYIMTQMSVEYPISLVKTSMFPAFENYTQTLKENATPMVDSILRHVFSLEKETISIDEFNRKAFLSFLSSADIRRSLVDLNGKRKERKVTTPQESVEGKELVRKLSRKESRKSSSRKQTEDHNSSAEIILPQEGRKSIPKKPAEENPRFSRRGEKLPSKPSVELELVAKARKGNYQCLLLRVKMRGGENILFCTCGKSKSDPICDMSHNGMECRPIEFTATEDTTYFLCRCKHSKKMPHCDGTHNTLAW